MICLHTRQDVCFKHSQQNKIIFLSKRAVYTKYCHFRTHMKLMTRICLRCHQMVVYVFGTLYLLVLWCFRPDFILNIIYLKTGHVNSVLPPPQHKHTFFACKFSLRFLKMCHCKSNWRTWSEQLQESQYWKSALSAAYRRYIVFFRSKKKINFSKLL